MWFSVGAKGATGAIGATGAAGCTCRTDCTSRTSRTDLITDGLPRCLAQRSVILRLHLLELIGHFVGARKNHRLVTRFDLTPEPEFKPLQFLGVLVDAVVLEPPQR